MELRHLKTPAKAVMKLFYSGFGDFNARSLSHETGPSTRLKADIQPIDEIARFVCVAAIRGQRSG
ncbi:MAG: hypothetical protein ABIQ85_05140 [Cypionkella sp.]